MVLKIRLARGGAKKRPYYAIVVADSHSPRDGRFIEKVGTYNPLLKKDDAARVTLKLESIQAWIAKGAQPTDRVARFLAAQGIGSWTHSTNPEKGAPGKRAQERIAERAQRDEDRKAADVKAAEDAAAAAIQAKEDAKAAAEAAAAAAARPPERYVPWKAISDFVPSPSPLRLSDLRELSPREKRRTALLDFGLDTRYAVDFGEYDYLAATLRGGDLFFECCLPSGGSTIATTPGIMRWEGRADPGVLLASVLTRALPEDVLDTLSIDLLLPDRIITFEETARALANGSFAREVQSAADLAGPNQSRAAYGVRAYGAVDEAPFELFISRPKTEFSSLMVAKGTLALLGVIAPLALNGLASLQSTVGEATRHVDFAVEAGPEAEAVSEAWEAE